MWLLLAFLTVPLIEIALFIQVGGWLGLWPTLAIVVITAVIGTWLMRAQGAAALNDLRTSFTRQADPTEPLAHGAMILIAGVLLLTPGFFTDALGFALLMPAFRRAAYRYLRARVRVQSFHSEAGPSDPRRRPQDPSLIEGEYHEIETPPDRRPGTGHQGSSGWTRH
ncbi:FxsA family protein [Roseovarius spongiae]|uniref:FxsA family protein n=1 Tax=Roseovarius spongiae TaxID=2320272 RepID=A0A3A8AU31_9RHOB|nr:FxsA family protein [Roseovarius spongiae]RKF13381.1 FxsA family protein [Roseovarius spongiae]